MKKNSLRLTKLEASLVVDKSDSFKLSDFEILERIEECVPWLGMKPTQKFLDEKRKASRTRPMFSLKQCQRLRAEEAELQAEKEAMSDQELDDLLSKAIRRNGGDEEFEDMSDQEIEDYNKSKSESQASNNVSDNSERDEIPF
jgi:hypothetical protein